MSELEIEDLLRAPLRTKYIRPKGAALAVHRPQLLERLDEGLSGSVTLISAPAGFGKTTIASSWLKHVDEASHRSTKMAGYQTGWISLDVEDDYLPNFVTNLIAVLEQSHPDRFDGMNDLLQARPLPSIETLADYLLNTLAQLDSSIVIVLDDLHLLKDAAIFVFLTRCIEYRPSQLHFVLITRVDPPLPISRWRGLGLLNELRLHDMSFTLEETTEYLRNRLHNMPSAEIIKTLHTRTEGWAVGIGLGVLILRNHSDYAALASHFQANTRRYTIDYLVDEVLSQQTQEVEQFMVSTAILGRFCAQLCAAILDIDEETAAQRINYLLSANLFVIEVSNPSFWYRYHHQFQEMLLSRLHMRYSTDSILLMHRRAAEWLIAHGFISEGLQHLVDISDYDAAAQVIEHHRMSALNELRFLDLGAWLRYIPSRIQSQHPGLLIGAAWVQYYEVDNARCLSTVIKAEALLEHQPAAMDEPSYRLLAVELVALRAALDEVHENAPLELIRQSWTQIRPHFSSSHCNVVLWMAYLSQQLGDLDLAMTVVQTAYDEALDWPMVARCRVLHTIGFLFYAAGDLAQAEVRFRENLRFAQQHDLPVISSMSHHGLGIVAEARALYETAEEHFLEVIRRPWLTNGLEAVVNMYSLIGINARRGHPEESRQLVEQLKEEAQTFGRTFLLEQFAALEAYVDLTCGESASAMRWAITRSREKMHNVADKIPVIRARVLLGDGAEASLREADQLLQILVRLNEEKFAWYRLTEALVLHALVKSRLGDKKSALASLSKAVELAVPMGNVEPFGEPGLADEGLLRELAYSRQQAPTVQKLLAAFPAHNVEPRRRTEAQPLAEPLTERELDVLTLLAQRLSNKEIAAKLIVSSHTVRNHTANIYGKLEVDSRVLAVERARKLGILPPAYNSPG